MSSPKMGKLISFASALVRRSQLASIAGKTFGTDRDLYTQLGYKRALDFDDYKERYVRGGIAYRIVNTPAATTWRNEPEISERGADGETEFTKAWSDLAERLKVFHFLERADKLAGIGQYGILLLGIGDARDTKEPVTRVKKAEDVIYLAPYSEGNAGITGFVDSPSDPRFGLPSGYKVNLARQGDLEGRLLTRITRTIDVHPSRILHIADGIIEDEVFGVPRLMPIWNYLDDLEKVVGASAESVWRTAVPHYQFDLDKDMDLLPEDEEDLASEIDELMHGLRRYMRTRGITAKQIGGQLADPRGMFMVLASVISGTTGIPMRILFGSERGQLASTQDEKNYNARIKERQTTFAEPVILRPFIDRMIEISAIPKPANGYDIHWPDLSTLTAKEKADVSARVAQGIRNIAIALKDGSSPISSDEFRRQYLGLEASNDLPEIEPSEDEDDE